MAKEGQLQGYRLHIVSTLRRFEQGQYSDVDSPQTCSYMLRFLERDRVLFPCTNWTKVDRTKPSPAQAQLDKVLREGNVSSLETEEALAAQD